MQPVIEFSLEQFEQGLTNTAQTAVRQFGTKSTGALKSSVKVEITGKGSEELVSISFNNYGLFIDAGVDGAESTGAGKTGKGYFGTSYKYKPTMMKKRPKLFAPVGGKLPFLARIHIRRFGINAKPWIQQVVDAVNEQLVDDIEFILPKQIESQVVEILKQIK